MQNANEKNINELVACAFFVKICFEQSSMIRMSDFLLFLEFSNRSNM